MTYSQAASLAHFRAAARESAERIRNRTEDPMNSACPYCGTKPYTREHTETCLYFGAEYVATLALDSGFILGDEPVRIYDLTAEAEKQAARGK